MVVLPPSAVVVVAVVANDDDGEGSLCDASGDKDLLVLTVLPVPALVVVP